LTVKTQIKILMNQITHAVIILVDSRCMSSLINYAFIAKHQIPTRATAVSILVYNANGTKNQAGSITESITEYVELRLTIGDHSEWIDLTVTNLGTKKIFLSHD
ncbi:uncharacterized protein BT62DRAFT_906222, partial [Guyanagaster necrorhizus]